MGLLDKARHYREEFLRRAEKAVAKEKLLEKFEVSDFILELFNESSLSSQVETAMIGLMNRFNVNNILINFLDEEENVYKLIGSKGVKDENKKDFDFEYDSYFIKALHTPVRIDELMNEPAYNVDINKFLPYNFKIIFPLAYGDEIKGFITLGEKINRKEYTSDDITEMQNLGKVIGTAIYNLANLEKMRQKYSEIKDENKNYLMLFEGFKNINLSENLEEALAIFYRIVRDIYNVNVANLLIKSSDDNIFKVRKSWGLSEQSDKEFFISPQDDMFKNVIEIGEAMLLPEFQNIEAFNKISEPDKEKIKFFYTVPIKLGEKCFGIFNVFNIGDEVVTETLPSNIEQVLSFLPFSLLPYILHELKEV